MAFTKTIHKLRSLCPASIAPSVEESQLQTSLGEGPLQYSCPLSAIAAIALQHGGRDGP